VYSMLYPMAGCLRRTLTQGARALGICLLATSASHSAEIELPELGDASSGIVSLQQERTIGQMWTKMFRSQVQTDSDPLLTEYLEHLVYKLSPHSELKSAPMEVIVVENRSLNAFAVPGGVVGIHNGLMLAARHEDELASVIAHELAHLSQRHFARGVEQRQNSSIPNMLALLGAIVIAATAGGDAGMAAISGTQAAIQQNQLRFSRNNEQEADRLGMNTLVDAGYDPDGMPRMFERMLETTRYNRRPPEFLLTHPLPESRVSDARNRAREYPKDQGVRDTLDFGLMRARVKLHFEESPTRAVKRFRAELEDSGGASVTARYGLVIALTADNRFDEARAQLQELLRYTPNSIPLSVAAAEIEIGAGRPDIAADLLRRQLAISPGNHPLTMVYSRALTRAGDYLAAESLLEEHTLRRPTDPEVWYQLAEVHGLAGNILAVHRARAEFFILIGAFDHAERQLGYGLNLARGDFIETARIDARLADIEAIREQLEEM